MSEKRRNNRRHRVRECMVTCREGGLAGLLKMKPGGSFPVSDVSQSGCSFVADHEFEQGSKIRVLLDIPAFVKPLKIDSDVMWCQKMKGYDNYYKIGVQFRKMSLEDQTKVNRLDHDAMLHHVRRDIPEDGTD